MTPKKALIISYYWPPAGGPGVQRWLKFATYLDQYNITPIMYVPENAHYPITDPSLISEVPENVTVVQQPINEPYKWAKWLSKNKTKQISSGIISSKNPSKLEQLMLFVRGNFFIPDARVGWVKPSVRFLNNYIRSNKIDMIITTGPPHSLHLIGLQLKKNSDIPWIADFRDPWTTIGYHQKLKLTKIAQAKHKKLEQEVLQKAHQIIVTSEFTKNEFQKITSTPIEVITNGFDVNISTQKQLDTSFTLAHIGSLLSDRNPIYLWKILSELTQEIEGFKNDFKLVLAGNVSEDVVNELKKYDLSDSLINLGYLKHNLSVELQRKSQVLLLLEIDREETQAIIPGKLFEYLAAKRPIVFLGPETSAVHEILANTHSGMYFSKSKKDELKKHIVWLYDCFKNGDIELHSKNIEQYSRKQLTAKLAQLLHSQV